MSFDLVTEIIPFQARNNPHKKFISDGDCNISYSDFNSITEKLASFFCNVIKLSRHDRILLMLPNSFEFFASFFAAILADCIVVPISHRMQGSRLRWIIKDSNPKLVISNRNPVDFFKSGLFGPINCYVYVGDSRQITQSAKTKNKVIHFEEILNTTVGPEVPQISKNIDVDPAMIIYTSGSTGEPKGILCSQSNIISASSSICRYLELSKTDSVLNALPPFFDYGLYQAILCARVGARLFLVHDAIFIDNLMNIMNREFITGFPIVPSIAAVFIRYTNSNTNALTEEARNNMSFITSTGAPFHPKYISGLRYLFPKARIYSMYGLTECKRVFYLKPELIDKKKFSVGKPMHNVEVSIVDNEGIPVSRGQVGTLVVRGSNVALGYWNDVESSKRSFRKGKFGERILHTNDRFKQDEEGFLYFVGRDDDIIKSGSMRISLAEIANVMLEIEGISEVAIISEPHEDLGEVMRAFTVLEEGNVQLNAQDIKDKMRLLVESNLMIPVTIEVVDQLPKTESGKVAKSTLKSSKKMSQ